MNNGYKAYLKFKALAFAFFVYSIAIGVLSWLAWYLTTFLKLSYPFIWQWNWWQITLFLIIFYVYSTIMIGVVKGIYNLWVKHKQFFLM